MARDLIVANMTVLNYYCIYTCTHIHTHVVVYVCVIRIVQVLFSCDM